MISKMTDVEIFESLLISDFASFILSSLAPETRTPSLLAAVTADTTNFVLSTLGTYSIKCRLAREQMLSMLTEKAKRSSHHVDINVETPSRDYDA